MTLNIPLVEKWVQINVTAQSENNTANTTEIWPGSERETTEEDETCDDRRRPSAESVISSIQERVCTEMPYKSCSGSGGDGFWGGSWEMGGTGGSGYLRCGLVYPRGCTPLPLSAAPVGISHTAILVSTIVLGFPLPFRLMLTIDNFVSGLVSFISHLGALPGSWTVTTLLALSRLLSLQGSGCRRRSPSFTCRACRPSHHTLTYVGKV